MIRCMIVDDEELARERIRRLLLRAGDFAVVGEHGDAEAALAGARRERPDLLFLDVQMPELDGFDLLGALPRDALPAVIFVTAHDAYAVRAFEHHALDYLRKPFTAARFDDALAHARARLASGERPRWLAVRTAAGVRLLTPGEIDWIGAADNYVELHAGDQSYLLRDSMQAVEARLGGDGFARIHRGAIVNLAKVRELRPLLAGDWRVILEGGARLRLSRTYRQRLARLLGLP